MLGPGGEPLGDGPGGEGAVVDQLGDLFAEVVDELGDSGGHGFREQRAGMSEFPFVLGGGAGRVGGPMLLGAGPAAGAGADVGVKGGGVPGPGGGEGAVV